MTESDRTADASARLLDIVRAFARESRLQEPREGVGLDTRLEADLGLDSLSRSELIARVESGLAARLPDEALLAATPRDLLALLGAGRGGPSLASAPRVETDVALGGAPAGAATLLDVLAWHRDRHGSRTHITYYDAEDSAHPISYADLACGAARVAERLRQAGLKPGETVAVMLPTSPDYFFSFFGILVAGGVPVPIYPPARPQQLEDHLRRHARILENAGVVLLITVTEARSVAQILRAHVASLKDIMTLDGLSDEPEIAAWAEPRPDDLAFLQYTSGSTGNPKGVMLSNADLLANIRAMGEAIAITPDDVFVSWLPLYHDMGLIGAWLGSLYFAVPLICMSPLAFLARPKRWLQAIDRHRGTLSAAPNFAYELCLTRLSETQLEGLDLSSWRRAFNGAEPVSAETLRRFSERFAAHGLRPDALTPVYGLAEAAVGLAFPPPDRGPRIDCIDRVRFASSGYALPVACDDADATEVVACGRPLPGYQVRVVDAQGEPLPERHEGLLQFQGPSATRGYFRNPEATAALIRDGWHETGDRAYLAGGDIHLTGRVKDLIIRGGRNLYPYEVEQALGELPGIRKGCVVAFAAKDPKQGSERLVIVAESKERDPARRAALVERARECATEVLGLPPDEIVLAPPRAVLKTSSGKLRRVDTRECYLEGKLFQGPPRPAVQVLRLGATAVATRTGHLIRRLPGSLYARYAWLIFYLIAPLFWILVMLTPRLRWRWTLVRMGIRLLRGLTGMRLRVTGREQLPPPGAALVLVANHQGYLDALALSAAIERPLTFVAKRELMENPLVARFLARMGTLFVERFDLHRSQAESRQLNEALAQGRSLAFFPEGTFREQPGLLPFRMGAFAAAAQASAPVLPVVIKGTREIMPGDSFRPKPGKVEVVIGPLIEPRGTDWQAAAELRDAARERIAGELAVRSSGGLVHT
ncbi:1-acylglycerol-3-phosphate O-acyltransferase [Thiorhodococcus mannitoliphagus]|uniref:1-acyl-sn-glycerol-3-phosphate acyltransferase n=1 Tax=Thiorhodococcus mannitoliphagus TaxID=329406 RepID=A0A6P1DYI7_9GAMM|nr:1-acylglycerol-3-phosphate O-acyltransferase [Thiorhodococcus mannitoliphagus]NEX20635.1 1-acylglycerol-3-phosphate O-acyltransferase [Thiorhodococcus mannitoliphagus]